MKETRTRQTNNDTPEVLKSSIDRLRRRVSRFQEFGILPEEVVVKIQGYLLSISEELSNWLKKRKAHKS